jgi:hypothetical protein
MELTYQQQSFWGGSNKGIPIGNLDNIRASDEGLWNDFSSAFKIQRNPDAMNEGGDYSSSYCDSNPSNLRCAGPISLLRNRSMTFPKQEITMNPVSSSQTGCQCRKNATCRGKDYQMSTTQTRRVNNLYGLDIPQVYVTTDDCTTITPEVTPNEITRDTTYGKTLWENPVWTFPEVTALNSAAQGVIYNRQYVASDGLNLMNYPTFTKNQPEVYIPYPNY